MPAPAAGRSRSRGGWWWCAPRRSSRALQALGDACDTRQQRLEQVAVRASPGAPALQQIHLHQVDGIEVGVAELDRALQRRIGIEQRPAVLDGENLLARALELAADLAREAAQPRRPQLVVAVRDVRIRSRQHGLDVIEEVAQEKPAA